MNILSINCGGLGQVHKQNWIRDIIQHEKLSVIGIQETKMEQIDQVFVKSLWIWDNVEFAFIGSTGASRGTLTIWNTSIFVKEGVLVGSSFSGAFGKWSGVNETIFLINIYGPQEDQFKEELLDELSCLMESRQWVWILFGDLNGVRYRVISNHCPILLKNCHRDYGSRPFKIFDFWANYDDVDELVLSSWCACTFSGTDDIKLKNKIKSLKAERLKDTQKSENLKRQLVEWDQKAELGKLSALGVENRDESKGRKFLVNGLICDGVWTDDPTVIKEAIYNHFWNRFKEPRVDRPKFIHESDALLLESSISMDELKRAVDDCSGSKAPGPDGLNFNFIKRYWEILKVDFHKCVAHFEATGRLSRGVNPSFITLVPKIKDTIEISDFRPISLIGCVYKVISKVLASRLAKVNVIDKIISPNQTASLR
ncbi:RNA-directed DNA polymerase, eukaryota [Tanacetum coccineum]